MTIVITIIIIITQTGNAGKNYFGRKTFVVGRIRVVLLCEVCALSVYIV